MPQTGRWIAGVAAGLSGLLGLIAASRAGSGAPYWGGLLVFALAVAAVFFLIHRGFDAAKGRPGAPGGR